MLNLFKKSKVKEGKQTQADSKVVGAANAPKKQEKPLAAFTGMWKKLNSMDRKQAYTWGAVVLVAFIGLLILISAASGDQDDFSDFETRGYDLANMPFSSDEAEQYLLASKYPDMKEGNDGMGLYSKEEKEARQAEDMENEESSYGGEEAGSYNGGGYYGGGRGGNGGARTNVGSLSSASIKGASGSGMSSKFGPSGDFSNFRSQNKGNDKAPVKGPGSGDARKALRQTAKGSRAAAGLKNDKLLNAKKALMGGTVDGSNAFSDDSGVVNLGEANGLELDTEAPASSADLSGLDDNVKDANDKAQDDDDDKNNDEMTKMIIEKVLDFAANMGDRLLGAAMDGVFDDYRQAEMQGKQDYEDAAKQAWEQKRNADIQSKCSDCVNDDGTLNMGLINARNSLMPHEFDKITVPPEPESYSDWYATNQYQQNHNGKSPSKTQLKYQQWKGRRGYVNNNFSNYRYEYRHSGRSSGRNGNGGNGNGGKSPATTNDNTTTVGGSGQGQ